MSTVGNILIIAAQLIVAVQMVVEEKFITGYDVPALQVVGLEGLFGFIFLTLILTVMYFVPPPAFLVPSCLVVNGDNIPTPDEYKKHFEDPIDAFTMFGNNPRILLAVLGNILSIAFFNYFGAQAALPCVRLFFFFRRALARAPPFAHPCSSQACLLPSTCRRARA